MFAGRELQFPGFHLLLLGKGHGFHNSIDHSRKLAGSLVNVFDLASIAADLRLGVIPILFSLRFYGNLGCLLWRLFSVYCLLGSLDIQHEMVPISLVVEQRMIPLASTAAIKAI